MMVCLGVDIWFDCFFDGLDGVFCYCGFGVLGDWFGRGIVGDDYFCGGFGFCFGV